MKEIGAVSLSFGNQQIFMSEEDQKVSRRSLFIRRARRAFLVSNPAVYDRAKTLVLARGPLLVEVVQHGTHASGWQLRWIVEDPAKCEVGESLNRVVKVSELERLICLPVTRLTGIVLPDDSAKLYSKKMPSDHQLIEVLVDEELDRQVTARIVEKYQKEQMSLIAKMDWYLTLIRDSVERIAG